MATSGLRTREARERALRLRNLDVLLGGFWSIVVLVCVLGSIALMVATFF